MRYLRNASLGLALAALLLALSVGEAGEISGIVVGHDGNPVPWIKHRIFNEAKKRYQNLAVPSVQIELTVRTPTEKTIGHANAEADGSFLITWDNEEAKAFSQCMLKLRKMPRDNLSPVAVKFIKLKLENDGEIDPDHADNKAITRPIVLRSVDDETPTRPNRKKNRNRSKKSTSDIE